MSSNQNYNKREDSDVILVSDKFVGQFYSIYGAKWNSLTSHSINDILNHKWYTEELVNSWNKSHDLHQVRCYKNCGDKGIREVIFDG